MGTRMSAGRGYAQRMDAMGWQNYPTHYPTGIGTGISNIRHRRCQKFPIWQFLLLFPGGDWRAVAASGCLGRPYLLLLPSPSSFPSASHAISLLLLINGLSLTADQLLPPLFVGGKGAMAWLLAGLEGRIIRWSVGWLVASCRRLPPLSSCFLALANPISFPPAPWPPHFVGQPIRGQPSDGKFSLLSYPLLSASSVFQQGKNANAKKLPDDDGMNVGWVPGVSAASLLFFFFC